MHFDYRFAYIKTESRTLDVIAARFINLVEALEYFSRSSEEIPAPVFTTFISVAFSSSSANTLMVPFP